jgi:hypothetical protein
MLTHNIDRNKVFTKIFSKLSICFHREYLQVMVENYILQFNQVITLVIKNSKFQEKDPTLSDFEYFIA